MTAVEKAIEKLNILSSTVDEKIEHSKSYLSARNKLIMDITDIGFKKISDTKYTIDIRSKNKSYVTFTFVFRNRSVDMYEDHLVVHNKNEVPSSRLGNDFSLMAVRYNKVLEELVDRAEALESNFRKEIKNDQEHV